MCGCKIVIKIHQDNLFHFLSIREPAVRNKSCDLIGDGSERYSPIVTWWVTMNIPCFVAISFHRWTRLLRKCLQFRTPVVKKKSPLFPLSFASWNFGWAMESKRLKETKQCWSKKIFGAKALIIYKLCAFQNRPRMLHLANSRMCHSCLIL